MGITFYWLFRPLNFSYQLLRTRQQPKIVSDAKPHVPNQDLVSTFPESNLKPVNQESPDFPEEVTFSAY